MLFKRYCSDLDSYIEPNSVLIILGPRQVGKTTLLENYLNKSGTKYKLDNGELLNTQHILGSQDLDILKNYAEGYDLIAIDEAHKIPNIGLNLKIMVDHIPGIRIIATGSSSFDLLGQVGEPLVGRKKTLKMFPLSQIELNNIHNKAELTSKLEEWLIYGGYPKVVSTSSRNKKKQLLNELTQGYMLNDRLIRPAKVGVSVAAKEDDKEDEDLTPANDDSGVEVVDNGDAIEAEDNNRDGVDETDDGEETLH